MKPLDTETNAPEERVSVSDAEQVAGEILETLPVVFRALRSGMKDRHPLDLPVGQFRSLGFLQHHGPVSLSELADHLGMTLPSASKLIDGLVHRHLVERELNATDRRRVTLTVTSEGRQAWQQEERAARSVLAKMLEQRSEAERKVIVEAMRILRPTFAGSVSDLLKNKR